MYFADMAMQRKQNGMVVKQLLWRKRVFYYRLVGFLVMAKHLLDSHLNSSTVDSVCELK